MDTPVNAVFDMVQKTSGLALNGVDDCPLGGGFSAAGEMFFDPFNQFSSADVMAVHLSRNDFTKRTDGGSKVAAFSLGTECLHEFTVYSE